MRIEKEIKNLLTTRNFSSEKNQTQFLRIQNWFSTHRLNSRQKNKNSEIKISTFFACLPLALGFSCFLFKKNDIFLEGQGKASKASSFFQTNLPVFKTYHPKLTFETFEYIVKPTALETQTEGSPMIFTPSKKKDFFEKKKNKNDVVLNQNSFFGQPTFVGTIKKSPKPQQDVLQLVEETLFNKSEGISSFLLAENKETVLEQATKKFSGFSCDSYTISSKKLSLVSSSASKLSKSLSASFLKAFMLDEFPSYLQGLNPKSSSFSSDKGVLITKSPALKVFSKKKYKVEVKSSKVKGQKSESDKHLTFFLESTKLLKKLTLVNSKPSPLILFKKEAKNDISNKIVLSPAQKDFSYQTRFSSKQPSEKAKAVSVVVKSVKDSNLLDQKTYKNDFLKEKLPLKNKSWKPFLLSKKLSIKTCVENTYYKNQKEFSIDAIQLQAEFQKVFIEKKISYPFLEEAKALNPQIKTFELFNIKNPFLKQCWSIFFQNEMKNRDRNGISGDFTQSILDQEKVQNNELFLDDTSEKILQNLEKVQVWNDSNGVRAMSGYIYPDTNTRDLEWFLNLQKTFTRERVEPFFFQEKRPFKVNSGIKKATAFFPSLKKERKNSQLLGVEKTNLSPLEILSKVSFPSRTTNYSFSVKPFPQIFIKTRESFLTHPETKKIIYDGPSVILDSKKNFDWSTKHQTNLQLWFQKYVSPLNPLVQFQGNFFCEESVEKISQIFSSDREKKREKSEITAFLPLKLGKNAKCEIDWFYDSELVESFFAPSISSLQIPSEKEQPDAFLNQENIRGMYLTLSEPEDPNKVEVFFPLLELKQPSFTNSMKQSKRFCHKTSFFENGYSSFFEFGVKGNPDFDFSGVFNDQKQFAKKTASGNYRKTLSFFSKNQEKTSLFVQNWEPLNATSWLAVSQLSFAIFSFRVLKSLSDNYGRELLGYLMDLVAALGVLDDSLKQQIQILTGERQTGFRVFLESRKKFTDIVGIQKVLLELYEIVLFLRNSGRNFTHSETLPHGILLTGPPGTGKTLLVQALAGEAQVPVIVLSGSSLMEPGESAAFKLQLVFQEARQLAPCIVFIDEIDTLSSKRSQLLQNPMANDPGFESFLESFLLQSKPSQSVKKTESFFGKFKNGAKKEFDNYKKQKKNPAEYNSKQNEKQVSLLSQLLIELDGIQGRNGVVIFGATNRPEVLDPALLRPGRFDKIVKVGLPAQKKRVEILQFYGQTLGYQKTMPWAYFGERTVGFTAADLATLMNESALKAILNQSNHTIETLEHGIERLTTSESEKYTVLKKEKEFKNKTTTPLLNSSRIYSLRLAYYQAGKLLLSYALETHPKTMRASLWPRRPTLRSLAITANLEKSLFEFARLWELTERIIGCYAGKAAEFLFLCKFSSTGLSEISTLGLEDQVFAQKLVYFMLENCHFYSKKNAIQQAMKMSPNSNLKELRKKPEKLDLYSELLNTIQFPPMWEASERETSSLTLQKNKEHSGIGFEDQIRYSSPWWQEDVSAEMEFKPKNPGKGSRLYLYDYERTSRNPEWVPPDEFYHNSSGLKDIKNAFVTLSDQKLYSVEKATQNKRKELGKVLASGFSKKENEGTKNIKKSSAPKASFTKNNVFCEWNEVSKLTRDYPAHSLLLQSFNKALVILNQNREILDRIVVELLYQEILKKPQIDDLMKELENSKPKTEPNVFSTELKFDASKKAPFVELSWGFQSRKPIPRWIDFAAVKGETT